MIIKQFLTYINWDVNYENNIDMKWVVTYPYLHYLKLIHLWKKNIFYGKPIRY